MYFVRALLRTSKYYNISSIIVTLFEFPRYKHESHIARSKFFKYSQVLPIIRYHTVHEYCASIVVWRKAKGTLDMDIFIYKARLIGFIAPSSERGI